MKNLLLFISGMVTLAAILLLSAYTHPDSTPTLLSEENAPEIFPVQQVSSPPIPTAIDFAGEELPMGNFDAVERFDRELIANCFRHSATFLYFKRAHRYFPIIEPILKEQGMPDDLKYLAVAESGLANARSHMGASGFWQFMSGSGKDRGLEVNSEIDERYHLEKATIAACSYLREARKDFGSWFTSLASYNVGKGNLRKRIREQGSDQFFDLNLNQETSRYVLRILAIKEIMQHPERYGFSVAPEELYQPLPPHKIVTVKSSVSSWADFAKKYNTNYRMLKIYNPWIRSSSLTNKYKKTYQVRVPA
ncbi:MAG: lytic transglycosylase domain-containing protein [Aureispira sp.]